MFSSVPHGMDLDDDALELPLERARAAGRFSTAHTRLMDWTIDVPK
ncbi:hypothetical protein ACFVUS_28000 [Nocardia sp. NPDC058058]